MTTAGEVVAIYDEVGTPIGTAPRDRVYAEGLWHASAGVLVRSTRGEVYVHRRSTTKSVFAGLYDFLAGGVVDPGESPLDAAQRELNEELGIAAPLTFVTASVWEGRSGNSTLRCHLYAYTTVSDGPFVHQPGEIDDGWWWPVDELREHVADPDWPCVPDSRALAQAANFWR